MRTLRYITISILTGAVLIIASCKDNNDESGTTGFKIKMSSSITEKSTKLISDTSMFDEVNIEVLSILIHYGDSAGNGSWMELETNSGIYDLMALDSLTALLASGGELPTGYISQLRLILGSNNQVVIDSLTHVLKTPSAQQSGLKLNLDLTAEAGKQYEILLDFNATQSIVMLGNGGFLLKPVLSISGIVEVLP